MLYILLFILKIIGWILLAIILLAVFLLCIVLFVPFKYRVEGSCQGDLSTLYARIRFSWILHLIGGYAVYENGELSWSVRVAWKKLQDNPDNLENPHTEDRDIINDTELDSTGTTSVNDGIRASGIEDITGKEMEKKESPESSQEIPEEEGILQHLKALLNKMKNRIKSIYQKIKYTFHKIYVTINVLFEKKDKLLLFTKDEIHRSAFWAVLVELRRLLKFLRPRHVKIKFYFGFSNPCTTGQVLALISMIYPYVGGHKEVIPDFEQKILEGTVAFRGKVRGLYVALPAWKLLMNKNVRTTYKHIKNFKL